MPHTDPNCIFCQIGNHLAPASIVYEDDDVIVFPTIRPVNPGHMLVVPKVHVASILHLGQTHLTHAIIVAQHIAQALASSEMGPSGFNILLSDGTAAFQDVQHFHLHVIPRFKEDMFALATSRKDSTPKSRAELDAIADAIRSYLPEDISQAKESRPRRGNREKIHRSLHKRK